MHAAGNGVNEEGGGAGTHEERVGEVDGNAEMDRGGARCATEGSDEAGGSTMWRTLMMFSVRAR